MDLSEMKQMAYFHAAPGMPGPFCPGCYAPLHGDMAFEWHSACFLKIKLIEHGPSALPPGLSLAPHSRRRQGPSFRRPQAALVQDTHLREAPKSPERRGSWRSSLQEQARRR